MPPYPPPRLCVQRTQQQAAFRPRRGRRWEGIHCRWKGVALFRVGPFGCACAGCGMLTNKKQQRSLQPGACQAHLPPAATAASSASKWRERWAAAAKVGSFISSSTSGTPVGCAEQVWSSLVRRGPEQRATCCQGSGMWQRECASGCACRQPGADLVQHVGSGEQGQWVGMDCNAAAAAGRMDAAAPGRRRPGGEWRQRRRRRRRYQAASRHGPATVPGPPASMYPALRGG